MPSHQLDALGLGLQQVRRHTHELRLQALGRAQHGAGDRDAEPGSAGPEVRRRRERVLGHDAHVVDLDAEVVGEQLAATVYWPCPSSAKPTCTTILPKRSIATVAPSGTPGPRDADDRVGVPVEDAGLDRVDETDAESRPAARAFSCSSRRRR